MCNHTDNGIVNVGGKKLPCCVICACSQVKMEIKNEYDGLENRTAKCDGCGKKVKSNWDLAFFEYCPNEEYDRYYCGCYGWD